jgi:hypothetical protein
MTYYEVKITGYSPKASKEHKESKFQSIHKGRCDYEVKILEQQGIYAEVVAVNG